MQTEAYRKPEGASLQRALEFTKYGVSGAEIYSFLSVNRENVPEGVVWCREENGKTVSVVYNNGDVTVTKQAGKEPYPGYKLLVFRDDVPDAFPDAVSLTVHDARDIYKIIGEKDALSPDEEARYVLRARLMRDGFSFGFGIKKEGSPVAFAFITAMNLDCAVIGDVFTLPAFRRRGFASRAVLTAVNKCASLGRTAYVVCEEKTAGFYEKLGFKNM